MEREFWLARWSNQEIGFHQPQVNAWLKRCWPELEVPADSRVFVPLCGKSLDLSWLVEQGHSVIGVELAESAVRAFYQEAGQAFRVQRERHLLRYSGGRVAIYCGDFMNLTALHLLRAAAVYDRAALIALPPRMRTQYADHLQRIVPDGCRMLLITLEYDQQQVAGPPHSVEEAEVRALFGSRCRIERMCSATVTELPPKFAEAGVTQAEEVAYSLVKTS
jgi:thiopurine S-methyltransferase